MKYRLTCLVVSVFLLSPSLSARAADAPPVDRVAGSKLFPVLSATYAVINALDVYTTTTALQSGAGVEANPLMSGVAGSPVALSALKAASTVSTIFLARRLWKRHPAGAITLLVAANVGMALVVSHNARVAGGF